MIGAILRILVVMEPGGDWRTLARLYIRLKRSATPSRNKLKRMVPAPDLLALGMHLMDTCAEGGHDINVATRFRDGLLIAILVACPVRLKKLTMITIGRQLIFHDPVYQLAFGIDDTKTGRPVRREPPAAAHRLCRSLSHGSSADPGLGCKPKRRRSRVGCALVEPMGQAAAQRGGEKSDRASDQAGIRRADLAHTFSATATRPRPAAHTARASRCCSPPMSIAVTELVDVAPSEIGIAPDLLGHAGLETTRKHYIQATGMKAHRSVLATLSDARAGGARTREREGAA